MTKKNQAAAGGAERRRTVRKTVLDTFQVFLVVPKRGARKIYLKDLSEGGIGFYAESDDKYASGDKLVCDFYINGGLKLPLEVKVAHVMDEKAEDGEKRLKIGCEFLATDSKAYQAFITFARLLDQLTEFVD